MQGPGAICNEKYFAHGPQNRRAASAGFTLLEVMVALAIMAIVLVSVYKMHAQSLAMNTAARFYTQAPLLAQRKLAELETSATPDLAEGAGDFGADFPGYTWKVATEPLAVESLGTIGTDLKKIDITVSLGNDEFVYHLRTYRLAR